MKEDKAMLAEGSSPKKAYSKTGQFYSENKLLPRPVWYKGSRDRGFRGDVAA